MPTITIERDVEGRTTPITVEVSYSGPLCTVTCTEDVVDDFEGEPGQLVFVKGQEIELRGSEIELARLALVEDSKDQ